MASFLIYDAATGRPLFVQQSRNPPALPAGHAFLPVPDGTLIARGDIVADGALSRREPTLDELKADKRAEAEAAYRATVAAGVAWDGVLYQIDPDSQARIAATGGLALAALTLPDAPGWAPDFRWIAADNSRVPMDARTAWNFAQAATRHASACVLNLRAVKDAIAGAADAGALEAVDVSAGYPASAP